MYTAIDVQMLVIHPESDTSSVGVTPGLAGASPQSIHVVRGRPHVTVYLNLQ